MGPVDKRMTGPDLSSLYKMSHFADQANGRTQHEAQQDLYFIVKHMGDF